MIGYVIVAKRVNELTEGGYDYSVPIPDVYIDPLAADYVRGGVAAAEGVEFFTTAITLP